MKEVTGRNRADNQSLIKRQAVRPVPEKVLADVVGGVGSCIDPDGRLLGEAGCGMDPNG